MIKVLFLIRKLDIGGAERQLIELIKALDKSRYSIVLLTFYSGGQLEHELAGIHGVKLQSLDKKGRWDAIAFVIRLLQAVRAFKPGIIHGYLSVANELSLAAGRLFGAKVVWGLRSAEIDTTLYDWSATVMFHLGAILSRYADSILLNSNAGVSHFSNFGYCRARMRVIPNGIDTDRFAPDAALRSLARAELKMDSTQPLVGRVGRMDPVKDMPAFLRAASMVLRKRPDVLFIHVGGGPEKLAREMHDLASSLGLDGHLRWLGARQDLPLIYNGMDLAVSSSLSEGFPNVIAEAMACGVPCVSTDVGDSAFLMGGIGATVQRGDPEALAEAMLQSLAGDAAEARILARDRIVSNFSLKRLQEHTEQEFMTLVHQQEFMVSNQDGAI